MELFLRWTPGKSLICWCQIKVRKSVLRCMLMRDYMWVSEWDKSEERRLWLCFAREACSLFSTNISEFVVPLHCFFIEWILVHKQAIFQNNIRVMLLTSSFPTTLLGEQSEESRCTAWNTTQTPSVTGTEDLWLSNHIMYVRLKLSEHKTWNILHPKTFFTLN